LFPAFQLLKDCLEMANLMLSNITIKENILADDKYKYLFSVEEVNKLVLQGIPFRDAYRQVGLAIEAGRFTYSPELHHVHEGSIGEPCNQQIAGMMQRVLGSFDFEKVHLAVNALLKKD
jgi:argininosuccinate lyase